jgi:uncharacterized protein (TIGR01244 family)
LRSFPAFTMFGAKRDRSMADIRDVTAGFAVAPQITPEDVAGLGGRFRLLINNRPDGEAPDQPPAAAIEAAARGAGLAYAWIPVSGPPGAAQAAAMRRALDEAEGPALAFCRSGTRSIVAWALAEALDGRPVEELEALGARAGYDLGPPLQALLPRVRAEVSG